MCNDHTMLLQRIAADMWPGASFDDLLAGVGGAGSALQALIDAITGKPGATLPDVEAVIASLGGADFAAFQQLLDGLAGKPNATVAEAVAGALVTTSAMDLLNVITPDLANLVTIVVDNMPITANLQKLIDELARKSGATPIEAANEVLSGIRAASMTAANAAMQASTVSVTLTQLLDGVAVKPGATVADAVAAILALGGGGVGSEVLAQQIVDAFGGKPNATVADLVAYISGVDDNLASTGVSAYATSVGLQQFLTAVAGDPPASAITIAGGGLVGLAVTAWNDLLSVVAGGGGNLGADLQPLLDLLGLKPGATVADVEVVWQALSNQANDFMVLLSLLSGQGANSNVTIADVQAGLPRLVEAIVQMVLSKPFAGPLNVSPSLNAGIAGDAEVVAVSPDGKSLNLNLLAPNGVVLANSEQILSASQITDLALAVVQTWLAADLNQGNGLVGAYVNGLGQDLAQEILTRTQQIEGLNLGYKHLRETLVLPTIRAITGSTDTSVGNGVDGPAVAAVKPAMDQIRADIAAAQVAVDALAALGVGGGDGTGLTAEQAQMILDTSTDLGALIAGITSIFTTTPTPTPESAVNAIRRITKDAETGSKIASAFLGGFLGKPITALGSTEQEALQAIVDWCQSTNATLAKVDVLAAENAALKARLDALEAKTKNLTADGNLSTANVLGDGFLDSSGAEILPNLQQGLQLFVDALTWGVEGGYGASGQTIETLYDALVAQHGVIETQTEISEYLIQQDGWVAENLTAIAAYIQEQIAEVTAFSQGIIDAMNGPNATLESIEAMFWLLNDVLTALIEATGIELPGGKIGAEK